MKATYDDAKSIMRKLHRNGHDAYLAGGAVRDLLLGLEPNDYDIATSAIPEEIQKTFEHTVPVGASFGVIKVICGDNRELDVATFRTDGLYSDNRRPDTVAYTKSAEEDVKRRDFTINALLMDINGKVIDYVGGQEDLKNRILQAVGHAQVRFAEDALRMMRAIRFAIRFKMRIGGHTWAAIKLLNENIKNVSKERVTDELIKIFSYGDCATAYFLLHKSGLWEHRFNKIDDEESWRASIALAEVRLGESFVLTMAIILAEAYPGTRTAILDSLALTNNQRNSIELLLGRLPSIQCFLNRNLAEQRKMMQWENKDLILRFFECQQDNSTFDVDLPSNSTMASFNARMQAVIDMGWPGPLINGNDLISMGFTAGPVFTSMLELIRDEQLEGRLTEVEQVKPFLIKKFPATPRKLDNGKMYDDTVFRRVMAQCPQCGRSMSCAVSKSPEGRYLWNKVTEKMNMRTHSTHVFFMCSQCGGKKSKKAFVEVKI